MVQDIDIIDLFTRSGTYVLAIAIWFITLFIRRVIENINPSLKKQVDENAPGKTYLSTAARWWNDVVLGTLPTLLGLCAAFIPSDFIFGPIGDRGGKFLFAGAIGSLTSFLFKLFRKVVKRKLGVDLSPESKVGDSSPPSKEE